MAIQIVPTQAIPNQRFQVVLGGQNCIIHLYQKGAYMYLDLTCNGVKVRDGAICLPNIVLTNYPTPNFSGVLFFTDNTDHDQPPYYKELGKRYFLCYDEEE